MLEGDEMMIVMFCVFSQCKCVLLTESLSMIEKNEKDAVDTKNIRKFQHYNPILRKGVQNKSTVFEGEKER